MNGLWASRPLAAGLVGLSLSLSASAAELYLRNGADDGDSMNLQVGDTGTIEIVLELADGEIFGYANVFLDTSPADASAMVQVQAVTPGLDSPFVYDRSNFDLPAAVSLSGNNEYGLVMGQGSLSGPNVIVLDTLEFVAQSEGEVEVVFETGARQPSVSTPSFTPYSLAPVELEPGFPNFVYLGVGDGRTGGVGPFTVVVGDATNTNDNTATNVNASTGNDNDEPEPNDNDGGGATNDNTAEPNENTDANDNVDVVRPEDPEVDINENEEGELLGTVEDSDGQIAVFIQRDSNNNPVAITGLVSDYRGMILKLTVDENLLTGIETEDGDVLDVAYDAEAGSVTLADESGSVTVVLPLEIDLSDTAGAGAVGGESGGESMERLLDELADVMGPIVDALADDGDAVDLLNSYGGVASLQYAFMTSADNAEDANTDDNVTDGVDFGDGGDSSIDDPLDDLDDLTEPDAGTPPRDNGNGGGGGGGFCGFGMISGLALSLAGLMSLRLTRRRM